jgi:hypothetical protein
MRGRTEGFYYPFLTSTVDVGELSHVLAAWPGEKDPPVPIAEEEILFPLSSVRTASGAHPTPCLMTSGASFTGSEARAMHEADHWPQSNVEIKNEWSCTSTLPYASVACVEILLPAFWNSIICEIYAVLGFYAVWKGISVLTFKDSLLTARPLKMGPKGFPETSVGN